MRPSDDDPRVVLVTAPDEQQGLVLARALVAERRAACVNLVPRVTSVYRWKGKVEEDSEVLLVIKTTERHLRELGDWLAREHPYDVPECIGLAPQLVEARYLEWLQTAVSDSAAS